MQVGTRTPARGWGIIGMGAGFDAFVTMADLTDGGAGSCSVGAAVHGLAGLTFIATAAEDTSLSSHDGNTMGFYGLAEGAKVVGICMQGCGHGLAGTIILGAATAADILISAYRPVSSRDADS